LDHNSQLYSKNFLDPIVPFLSRIATMTDSKAKERVQVAKDMLTFTTNDYYKLLDAPTEDSMKMWFPENLSNPLNADMAFYFPRKQEDNDLYYTFDLVG